MLRSTRLSPSASRRSGIAGSDLVRMVNLRNGWRGHLWQERFGSFSMDEPYTYHAVRYVLRNPVRAGIVRLPWRYEWSSAAFRVGQKKTDPLVKPNEELDEMVGNWQEYLVEPDADEVLCRLRSETAVGRPLGDAVFVQKPEVLSSSKGSRRISTAS
jgi:putative transposase